MVDLRGVEGCSALALDQAVLPGEVRGRWAEIDLDAQRWIIPVELMKAKKEHSVPLSKQAIQLMEALDRIEGSGLILPGRKPLQSLSEISLTTCMRRMTSTSHGQVVGASRLPQHVGNWGGARREALQHWLTSSSARTRRG